MSEATTPVRWGILGCARIATNRFLPGMRQAANARAWAIASRSLERAQEVAREYGAAGAYGSYEELLADPTVEAIYIPLPNHLHKPWAIAALRAGKHVLCEKPIALNAAEAREMQAVARETGRYLLEAFMYRLSPIMLRAIEILRSGALGEPRALYASFSYLIADDPRNVRLQADMGGGALYDVGCYCLNVLRMLAGCEPRALWAKLSWSGKYGVDMAGAGTLDFGGGLFGTFDMGFNAKGWNYFRAVGAEGALEAPQGFLGRGAQTELALTTPERIERIVVPLRDAYALEIEDLSAAIRGERPPRYADEPLDATMRLLDACYASDRTGMPITL